MPVPMNKSTLCPHCQQFTMRYFDGDGIWRCYACQKPMYDKFKKFCPTCKRMSEYESQTVMHGDACVVCGDMVQGSPIPYRDVEEGGHEHDEVDEDYGEKISIIPAWEIYKQHRGSESIFVHGLYLEFNFQFLNSQNRQVKMQAWQYVKACVKLLKEMNRWITWRDFEPGTEGWQAWWKEHPEDREDMAGHINQSSTMATRAQELMASGMTPEDVKAELGVMEDGTF